jgi:hypothetical protein
LDAIMSTAAHRATVATCESRVLGFRFGGGRRSGRAGRQPARNDLTRVAVEIRSLQHLDVQRLCGRGVAGGFLEARERELSLSAKRSRDVDGLAIAVLGGVSVSRGVVRASQAQERFLAEIRGRWGRGQILAIRGCGRRRIGFVGERMRAVQEREAAGPACSDTFSATVAYSPAASAYFFASKSVWADWSCDDAAVAWRCEFQPTPSTIAPIATTADTTPMTAD